MKFIQLGKKVWNIIHWKIYRLYRNIRRIFVRQFIISFPKSGRTWVRHLLGAYNHVITKQPITLDFEPFSNTHKAIPATLFTHAGVQSGLSLHTVDRLLYRKFCKKRVVFLVRDPRDVVVSFYFHMTKKRYVSDAVREGITISEFIRHEQYGIERIIAFMNLVYAQKDTYRSFAMFRYEDFQSDTEKIFTALLEVLHVKDISQDGVKEAITLSSFERMKHKEKTSDGADRRLTAVSVTDEESYKVRKGKVGGYVDYLDADDIHYVNKCLKALDPAFGYSL